MNRTAMGGVLVVASLTVLAGGAAAGERTEPKGWAEKRIVYAMNCDRGSLQSELIDRETWRFSCEDRVAVATCWQKHRRCRSDVALRKKAPFDLNCDAADVRYTYIDPSTRGVEACGKRATYVSDRMGVWLMNVVSSDDKGHGPMPIPRPDTNTQL